MHTQGKSSEGKHPFKVLRWKSQDFPVTAGVLLPGTSPTWLTQSTKGSRGRWGRLITHRTANLRLHAGAEDSSSQPCCRAGQLDKGLGETGTSVTPPTGYLSVRILSARCSSVWVATTQLGQSGGGLCNIEQLKSVLGCGTKLTQRSNPWTAEGFQKPAATASGGTQTCNDIWSHSRE